METTKEKDAPHVEGEKTNGAPHDVVISEGEKAVTKPSSGSAKPAASSQIEDLLAAVKRLEAFASDEAKRVSTKLVPVETKAKENFWATLFIALGLGLIFGLIIGGGRRRD